LKSVTPAAAFLQTLAAAKRQVDKYPASNRRLGGLNPGDDRGFLAISARNGYPGGTVRLTSHSVVGVGAVKRTEPFRGILADAIIN